MQRCYPQIREALQHPVLSKDNNLLLALTPTGLISIISLRTGCNVAEFSFPQRYQSFLSEIRILKWAPETVSFNEHRENKQLERYQTWVLFAGGSRLIVIAFTFSPTGPPSTTEASIIADYVFEPQHGRIMLAEFVFNHKQALITFDMNVHASIVSFDKLHRHDIPHCKFPDQRGLSQSHQQRHFAVLTRSKGQDQVVVFGAENGSIGSPCVFSTDSIDAQGLKWSSGREPLLVIWESAAYGPYIQFYTALGHRLRHLDPNFDDVASRNHLHVPRGMGITHVSWTSVSEDSSLLVMGIEGGRLLLHMPSQGLTLINQPTLFQHKPIVDTSQCAVWLQTKLSMFEKQQAAFEVCVGESSEVKISVHNVDATLIATKLDTQANAVWIWSFHSDDTEPHPSGLILFEHEVRRILWHPTLPNILAVITREKPPAIYISCNLHKPPVLTEFGASEVGAHGKLNAEWILCQHSNRCPLLVSNNNQFDVGLVTYSNEKVAFSSILENEEYLHVFNDETSLLDTPSKPEKISRPTTGWQLDGKNVMWDSNASADCW